MPWRQQWAWLDKAGHGAENPGVPVAPGRHQTQGEGPWQTVLESWELRAQHSSWACWWPAAEC